MFDERSFTAITLICMIVTGRLKRLPGSFGSVSSMALLGIRYIRAERMQLCGLDCKIRSSLSRPKRNTPEKTM
jgi:hypothetical protein